MKKAAILLLGTLLSIGTYAQKINKQLSEVTFSVSNMKVNTVEGTIKGMEGIVQLNKHDITQSKFDVTIDVATIQTGIEKRDKHLKNEDFFEISKHPVIGFKSTKIEKDNTESYIATGTLTIKDVSKEVTIPFTVTDDTIVGKLTIKRKEYHVGMTTGFFSVGEEVDIYIKCALD